MVSNLFRCDSAALTKGRKSFFDYKIYHEILLFSSTVLLLTEISLNYGFFALAKCFYLGILFLCSVSDVVPKWIVVSLAQVGVWLFFAAIVTYLLLDFSAQPVSAQFMQQGQAWMEGQFPDAGEVIALAFNVLRGLFLLYLGVSLVKVINAAREEEDWKSLARTPLITLITVTMGDILVGLITGEGGGGAPA